MQPRRHDDQQPGQRRVMPSEQFSRVIAPGAAQRFDNNDNTIPTNLAYPMTGYGQITQPPQHLQPQQAVHPPVGAAALSAVHQGGVAPSPAVHPPTPLQAGSAAAPPPVNQMAQVPQGGLGAPPPGPQQQQQFQRLKVEDALSYLDQVKLQFGNQPSVYNDFLDIMKEFKSQTIDTPGVINRVSNLFKGHPDLIVGFNTFLPPGYKIEVERDVINVYQPGQASMPISALNAGASASAAIGLQSQAQKSPAHIPSVAPPLSQPAPPPAIHHTYTQPPRPAHPEVPPLPLPHHSQPPSAASTSPQGGNQPVEFNHAINYVNKIKNRFQGQPEVYKQFLEILHTYQKEQRHIKEGLGAGAGANKPLTETEVYAQVAKLFVDQEDLLSEFGQFLPDANGGGGGASLFLGDATAGRRSSSDMALGVRNDHSSTVKKPGFASKAPLGKASSQLKRPPSIGSTGLQPPSKKYKTGVLKDVSMAEAGKYASLKEYAFFDQVRVALRSNEVYNNFLRCLILFNSEVISRGELINMVHPFLGKYPELYKWFKEFLGHKESGNATEALPHATAKERSVRDEYNMEIDYQSCKQYGASYRALPSSYPQPKCSGRTQLCREVLNDTWVSIPTWSEDSTFVTSRKSQFEEYIYKCEDERFELDVVLEMNFATIKTLEAVQRKMQRMTTEEAAKFRLDNTLGGSSEFVAKKAICRIYGEKSADIIDGLKKNPVVAVPLVLRRLKAKDEEWREAQKSFNKVWREQNEKYYLKSLDHQGMTFKQNDIKALRGKSLVNEIETILEEQNEANQQGQSAEVTEPHIKETYEDKSVFDDAASIIIHNMKRQSNMHHEDKKKIKQLVYHFVRDLLFYPRGELSDDEDEDTDGDGGDKKPKDGLSSDAVRGTTVKEEKEGWGESRQNGHDTDTTTTANNNNNNNNNNTTASSTDKAAAGGQASQQTNGDSAELDLADEEDADDHYTLFYGNTQWYLFFRLHFRLCQRLLHFRRMSDKIAQQEENSKADRKPSTALALRLRTTFDVEPKDYYSFFLESIKNLMDCSVESGTYEDTLREMYGINSYLGFTMDKQVVQIVRNLHHLVTEESSTEMTELFLEEKQNQATGGPLSTRSLRQQAELNYQRRAENLMADDNCFKFVFYKKSGEVHMTLLDQGNDAGEEVGEMERWAAYVERYVSMAPTDPSHNFTQKMVKLLCDKPVFLSRNIASWRRRNLCGQREEDDEEEEMEEEDRASDEEKEKKDDDTHSEDAMGVDRPKKSPNQNMLNFHLMECVKDVNDGKTMIADGAGVRFTINSLKMQHICWGAEMWYRRSALHNARKSHRQVSLVKHNKLWRWLEAWRKEKVTTDDEHDCEDWMMGRGDNILPNTSTTLIEVDNPDKPPYYPYHRYRVRCHTPTPTPVSAPTPTPTPSSLSPTPPSSSSTSVTPSVPLPSAPAVTSALPLDLQPGGRPSSRPSSRPSTPAE